MNYINNLFLLFYCIYIYYSLVVDTLVSGRFGPKKFSTPTSKHRTASVVIGRVVKAVCNLPIWGA